MQSPRERDLPIAHIAFILIAIHFLMAILTR